MSRLRSSVDLSVDCQVIEDLRENIRADHIPKDRFKFLVHVVKPCGVNKLNLKVI